MVKNYSAHPYRWVDRTAQLAFGVNPFDAIGRLKPALAAIPNVMADPAPDVEILDFNQRGTGLAMRPYCHTDHYWQVYFDTNKLIAKPFGEAGYAPPLRCSSRKTAGGSSARLPGRSNKLRCERLGDRTNAPEKSR